MTDPNEDLIGFSYTAIDPGSDPPRTVTYTVTGTAVLSTYVNVEVVYDRDPERVWRTVRPAAMIRDYKARFAA